MDDELEKKLVDRFPKFFRDYRGNPMHTCMAWGCDHGDGWFAILQNMCLRIEKEIGDSQSLIDNFKFVQIKEKFGLLCVYFSGANQAIITIVKEAEEESSKTCEVCGSSDNVTTGPMKGPGWITTKCGECRERKTPVDNAYRRHISDLKELGYKPEE